jgi:pyruvate/2-oxoglutarate dehydrogenase complex dihydrolipoamide acyltransferase (E2) component
MAEHVVIMPPMGDAAGELVLSAWHKRPGDPVVAGEPLFEVATEKVTIPIEALVTGTVTRLLLEEGAAAEEGEPIAYIEDGAG